jgi:hypothetical protein
MAARGAKGPERWRRARTVAGLLACLQEHGADRQFRLAMCAAIRRVWATLEDPRSREAVEVVERFAEGQATRRELRRASRLAFAAYEESSEQVVPSTAANAAYCVTYESPAYRGVDVARAVFTDVKAVCHRARRLFDAAAEEAAGCRLLRCVFGDPFRRPAVDPAWLRWGGGVVGRLAQHVYAEQRYDELPVLADALEEAGCADAELLQHCRDPLGHARGCWVLDLLTGRG